MLDAMRMDALPPASVVRELLEGREARLPPTRPTRYVVDPVARRVSQAQLSASLADLPTIDPRRTGRPHRHFWAIAGQSHQSHPFYHCILHFDHEGAETTRDFGRDLPGEPLFVPDPGRTGEGEGWLLSLVYRAEAHRTDLYVLRPDNLETVCRLELPHHVPSGFHGTWLAA